MVVNIFYLESAAAEHGTTLTMFYLQSAAVEHGMTLIIYPPRTRVQMNLGLNDGKKIGLSSRNGVLLAIFCLDRLEGQRGS